MGSLEIITYEPRLFDPVLRRSPDLPSVSALRHRAFVDHYYGSSDHCRLFLIVGGDGTLLATQGVEWIQCRDPVNSHRLGIGSGFYSFRRGIGTYLLANWLRSCEAGLAFGATSDVHRMLNRLRWNYVPGINTYCLNPFFDEANEPPLRALAKRLANHLLPRRPLVTLAGRLHNSVAGVTVREECDYTEDLVAFESAFGFRFAPDLAHMAWRYDLRLPYARYRLFRVFAKHSLVGFVILLDKPLEILVAHSDGADPTALAAGTLQAIAALAKNPKDRRQVTLISSHPVMQRVYETAGFRNRPSREKTFAMGTLKGPFGVSVPVSDWLVNYDWGDRGLRRPFLDELQPPASP